MAAVVSERLRSLIPPSLLYGEIFPSLMKWSPKASRNTVLKPLLRKHLSFIISFGGLLFFLLLEVRKEAQTEREAA